MSYYNTLSHSYGLSQLFFFLLQYKLTVPKMGNIADLLAILSKETNIPKEKVV